MSQVALAFSIISLVLLTLLIVVLLGLAIAYVKRTGNGVTLPKNAEVYNELMQAQH